MKNYDILQPVMHTKKVDLVSGQGAELIDAEGKHYLDFNEFCIVLGQNNPHYIERMTKAICGVTSNKTGYSADKEKLYRYLMETTNHQFKAIHLTTSGSETTEWAVKTALKITGKTEILSFWNSIHGRTHLSASMSGMTKRKNHYGPIANGLAFGAYPNCAHCPYEKSCDSCDFFCLRHLDQKLPYESANDIGAVIVEPYQGGGVIVPPKGWLKALQDWAHARGALFIMDEIQSGMGRSGQMYCYQKEGLEPDMLLLGKGLGNGMHISALLTKEIPAEKYLHALTGGVGDDNLACTAACCVFEELLEHGLLEHNAQMGQLLREKLDLLAEKHEAVCNVRNCGTAAAFEIRDTELYKKVLASVKEKGLFVPASAIGTIMLKPPYTVTAEQIEKMWRIFEETLEECS